MKLIGVTFTYNESALIPYVMKYAEHAGFDKFIVYDNQSTDSTVSMLKKYPFVEVRTLDTGGKKSNEAITNKKNKTWEEFKEEKDVWLYIGDFDEVVYFKGKLKEYLSTKEKEGYNALNQTMMETICDNFPDKSKFVHECCNGGIFWGNGVSGGCKMTLFKPSAFSSVKYVPGAHRVTVQMSNGTSLKLLNEKEIKSFHIKFIDYEYCLRRKNLAKQRRGPDDVKKGYGKQYEITDNTFKQQWNERKHKMCQINDYLCGKLKGPEAKERIKVIGQSVNKTNIKIESNDTSTFLEEAIKKPIDQLANKTEKPKIKLHPTAINISKKKVDTPKKHIIRKTKVFLGSGLNW